MYNVCLLIFQQKYLKGHYHFTSIISTNNHCKFQQWLLSGELMNSDILLNVY